MSTLFPNKIPIIYYGTKEGKKYANTLMNDPVINNLGFIVKEDFYGMELLLYVEKNSEWRILTAEGAPVTDKMPFYEVIDFFLLGATEEAKTFVLVCDKLLEIIDRSPLIDKNMVLYLDVYGKSLGKRKSKSINTIMSIKHISIDGILCTQKEVDSILDMVEKDLGIRKNPHFFRAPVYFKGPLNKCIQYARTIEGAHGVTIYPENFITENNIQAIKILYDGVAGFGKEQNKEQYEKALRISKEFGEFIVQDAIAEFDSRLAKAQKEASIYTRAKYFNTELRKMCKENKPKVYEEYKNLEPHYRDIVDSMIFKKGFHLYIKNR
jgi:hypothetical protein